MVDMTKKVLTTLLLWFHYCLCQWAPGEGPWVLVAGYPEDGYFLNLNINDSSVTVSPLSDFATGQNSTGIRLSASSKDELFNLFVCDFQGDTCEAQFLSYENGTKAFSVSGFLDSFGPGSDSGSAQDIKITQTNDTNTTATLHYEFVDGFIAVDSNSDPDDNDKYNLTMVSTRDPNSKGQVWTFVPYFDMYSLTTPVTATSSTSVTYTFPPKSTVTSTVNGCANERMMQREAPTNIDGDYVGSVTTETSTVETVYYTSTYSAYASAYPTVYVTNTNCEPSNAAPTIFGPDSAAAADSAPADSDSSSSHAGIIAGPVVAGVAVIAILAFVVWCLKRRKRRQRRDEETREISTVYYGAEHDSGAPTTGLYYDHYNK